MTKNTAANNGDYTKEAHAAILAAVRDQHDFGGWLAGVLAHVASALGLDPMRLIAPCRIVGSRRGPATRQRHRGLG